MKTLEQGEWALFSVVIVNFEQVINGNNISQADKF